MDLAAKASNKEAAVMEEEALVADKAVTVRRQHVVKFTIFKSIVFQQEEEDLAEAVIHKEAATEDKVKLLCKVL